MNLIRELKINGMNVQEFERHGEFYTFVNGYRVVESYQDTIKSIVGHSEKNATEDEKKIREMYAKARTA